MCKILNTDEEINNDFLLKDNEQFNKYNDVINNLNEQEPYQLVDLSHQNLEYINVRKKANIEQWQPCCLPLDETSDDFKNFGDGNSKIKKFFMIK